MRVLNEYALYKGEELLSIGTIREIAEETEVKVESLYYLLYPAYQRKLEKRKNKGKNARVLVKL